MRQEIKEFFHQSIGLQVYDPHEPESSTAKPYLVVYMGDQINSRVSGIGDEVLFETHVVVDAARGGMGQLDEIIENIRKTNRSEVNGSFLRVERIQGRNYFDEGLKALTRYVVFRTSKFYGGV